MKKTNKTIHAKKRSSKVQRLILALPILLGLYLIYAVFFANNAHVIVYENTGDVIYEDISNPESPDTTSLEAPEEEPTECLEPKAAEHVSKPTGWTVFEKAVNTEAGNYYNYVGFRSPDYKMGVVGAYRQLIAGAEINFLIGCTSEFSSIEELIDYEKESRVLKDSDQEPVYFQVDGIDAVQYYFGTEGKSQLITVWFANGYKFTLQYNFPVYEGSDTQLVESFNDLRSNYRAIYDQVLGSVEIPQ